MTSVMKLDIGDIKNRSLRKTLIFKNTPQPKKQESWDESKDNLIKEIRSVRSTVEETVIRDKTERAHKTITKPWKSLQNLMTGKFNKSVKTSFIRAKSQIYVSQMYSPKKHNEAMKVRKDLKRNEPNIQAYAKFPAQLIIKRRKGQGVQLIC